MPDEPHYITIKDWGRFQHYKGRKPPWIKLYRDLLDNWEYRAVDPQYRALLMDLWLLAAEDAGKVLADCKQIAWRLRSTEVWIGGGLHVLADAGFIGLPDGFASTTLAERKHVATPETETDLEIREKTDTPSLVTGTLLPAVVPNGHLPRRNGTRRYSDIIHRLGEAMAEVAASGQRSIQADEARELQAEVVFAYWAAMLGHDRALMDGKRTRRLLTCLSDNHGDVHELLFVVDGARRDPFLMGKRGEGQKYDGIETLFRDRAQVERLSELGGYKTGIEHPLAQKYAALVALP